MSLELKLLQYIEELEATNAECHRPKESGDPCLQCYERARIIRRLKEIISR